ncbi:hypothetical protein LX36DRAFT_48569 [Colletotrichum falcatum]|nr:hypothetical protein LX36DRAFT_48569 [Colletotrichum falcatum]
MTSTSTASLFLGGTPFFFWCQTWIERDSRTLCVYLLGSHDEAYAYVKGGSLVFQSSPTRPSKLVPERESRPNHLGGGVRCCLFATSRRPPRSAGEERVAVQLISSHMVLMNKQSGPSGDVAVRVAGE